MDKRPREETAIEAAIKRARTEYVPPPPNPTTSTNPAIQAAIAQAALIQQQQQQALMASVAATLNSSRAVLGTVPGTVPGTKRAAPLVLKLDAQGREIDAKGNLVQDVSKDSVATLKVNARGKSAVSANNPYLAHRSRHAGAPDGGDPAWPEGEEDDGPAAITSDPRIKIKSREKRAKRAFVFVAPGAHTKAAEKMRTVQGWSLGLTSHTLSPVITSRVCCRTV